MFEWLKRQTFVGRTDQYLTAALTGLAVVDPLRDYFSQHWRDDTITRLNRYHKNWRFYNKRHYTVEFHGGDRKLVTNLCRAVVDKSADWLMAKGFKVCAAEGNDALSDLLRRIWDMNNARLVGWRAAQLGGVSGDAFFFVTVPWLDAYGRFIPPENRSITIQAVNSSFCHPRFASSEDHTVTDCLIQYPVIRKKYNSIIGVDKDRELSMYSQYININEIREFVDDKELPGARRENVFGCVPVAHVQNLPHPGFFGLSDLDDIVDLNEEFNEVSESIRKIVKYHAEPTTMIFGAKAENLVRGANKVWSGLPIDARVENLALNASLVDASNYRDSLKLAICELSGTPEQALGKIQAISNTSNAALQTAYMPLIEKTNRKCLTYGAGIAEVNRILVNILETYFHLNIAALCGNPARRYESYVEFPSPLPTDESEQIDNQIKRMDHNLQSEAGALQKVDAKNFQSKSIEIVADKREKLLRDAEAAKAAMGQMPNMAVHSVGSLGLNPGVAEAFEAQDMALDKIAKQQAEQMQEEETEE